MMKRPRRPSSTKKQSLGQRNLSTPVKTAKGRKLSSTRWLQRQLNDPYVAESRRLGYRSRAAFKLIELDDRFGILALGQHVLDLGAAPGGWTQVAVERTGGVPSNMPPRVLAIDLSPIDPIPGARCLSWDMRDAGCVELITRKLGAPVDAVLSDMAPAATGHAGTDHLRIMALVEAAWEVAEAVLATEGAFVAKVLQGGTERELLDQLKRRFARVRHAKPPSSRKESAEIYVVAQGFRRS